MDSLSSLWNAFNFMPEDQASTWAPAVDHLNTLITNAAIFCTVAIVGTMLYFAIRYRRRSEDQEIAYIEHNTILETVWTVIPSIICIFLFYFGFVTYHETRNPPANALEVNVTARKWAWTFQHTNGKTDEANLVVPLGQPVRLIMRSKDVLHSFFVPAMRIKEDVMANIYTFTWFNPVKLGTFHIFCAEYCGKDHSAMLGSVKVVTSEEYADYLHDRGAVADTRSPAEIGKELYTVKGCNACHSLDGSRLVGPSFKGLTGSIREFENGVPPQKADENYIRESILLSQAKVVKTYPAGAMPSFEGLITDDEIEAMIAFIKSQK